jgi:hypothetical protein
MDYKSYELDNWWKFISYDMIKEYEIIYEPVVVDGVEIPKYNIYYYINDVLELIEYHSTDGINGEIRYGYKPKNS